MISTFLTCLYIHVYKISKYYQKNVLKIEEQLTTTLLTINLELFCGCECENANDVKHFSDLCNGNGNLTCGQCDCNSGW